MKTTNNYYIHVVKTRFCALVDSWAAESPVLCHLFRIDSMFKENPCIRLARGKFELANHDSVGGKNSSVLSDVS